MDPLTALEIVASLTQVLSFILQRRNGEHVGDVEDIQAGREREREIISIQAIRGGDRILADNQARQAHDERLGEALDKYSTVDDIDVSFDSLHLLNPVILAPALGDDETLGQEASKLLFSWYSLERTSMAPAASAC
jgi:hypothetical protein